MAAKAEHEVILYHFGSSLCSQKCRLALAEANVAYTSTVVDLMTGENCEGWYALLNPKCVVPTLEIDERTVVDSVKIMEAIDTQLGNPTLKLKSNIQQVMKLVQLQDNLPMRAITYISLVDRVQGIAQVEAKIEQINGLARDPRLRDCLKPVYASKIADLHAWMSSFDVDRNGSEHQELIETIASALDDLEKSLANGAAPAQSKDMDTSDSPTIFLAGTSYTLADVAWTPVLCRLEICGLSSLWEDGVRPLLAHYIEHTIKERPSWTSVPGLGSFD